MEKNRNLLKTVKEFCITWFKRCDLKHVIKYLSEDILFMGTGENEIVTGIEMFQEYIKEDIEESKIPFEIEFIVEKENYITESTGIAILEFNMKNSIYEWHIHSTFTLTINKDKWIIRHIHFSIPTTQQINGEHYPVTLVKDNILNARHELLSSSIAGGIIGGYLEDKFPFYYINDKMLTYLGYNCEKEFIEDIEGYIINCMHPDDWDEVSSIIGKQLSEKDEYTVEYRMRKKNGNYIYVHDIGKVINIKDGRSVVISVCTDISEQIFEKQQNESLIKAINGGIMICKIFNNKYLPVYLSSGIGSVTGYTKQELKDIIWNNIEYIIYPNDREKLFSALKKVMKSKKSIEGTYRVRHKNGYYVWVTSIFQENGEEDGIPLLHCVFSSLSNQFELQNSIMEGIDTGIYVINPKNYELSIANEAAFKIMERNVCDYMGQKCYEVFAGRNTPCEYCMIHSDNKKSKEVYIPSLDKTLTITMKNANWTDKDVVIEYINDITEQKKAQKNLKLGEERLSTAIRHSGIQFWEYDVNNNKVYMSDFSQESYNLPHTMENFPDSFLEIGLVHPDDEDNYREIHEKLKNGAENAMLEYRVKKSNGQYSWLLAHYTNSFNKNGYPVRAFATAEPIDKYKKLEEQFVTAAMLTGIRVWTLDIQNRVIYFNDSEELTVVKSLSCKTEKELCEFNILHHDDIHEVWKKFLEIFNGSENVSFKARMKINNKYRWNKISYTIMKSKSGIPVKAIGASIDIHEHMLLEQKFKWETEYLIGLQDPNLVNKAQCNITKGIVDLYLCDEVNLETKTMIIYDEGLEKLAMSAVETETQKQIRYLLNRKRILDAYAKGENSYNIEYQKRNNNGVFWVNTIFRVYQNPDTGDVMSFIYTYNIDDKKTTEAIIDCVVDANFEYLTLFSTVTGLVERTIDKSGILVKPKEGSLYEIIAEKGLCKLILPEEIEQYLPLFKMEFIKEKLNINGTYSISANIFDPKLKEQRHKLWVFNWFDKQHTKVLCSRSDITEAYYQEQRQKEALSDALIAAKQANAAKSDFLSRISHEIRTPMNVIIGMTTIAAKSIGNDDKVSDCIRKIGISSRFLLSLINDILDMSRIESGNMLLKSEKILFKEFITGINVICHTQASVKDIDYECIIDPIMDEYYIGDEMKLQQVLVNILSNAIKFTDSGGKVTFCISQKKKTKNAAVLRFVINDTGIGISEEFLPHLFEPFEQESSNINIGFGGTGLGLAISKNIIDLMDGKINVRSIKGIGTEFTIDVKLGLTEEEKQQYIKKHYINSFSHLKTLVVDDDIAVCESAVLMLKEIGITAEWVDSGKQAVNKVQDMWHKHKYYDMIIIDWKMPEMNGIETSRQIRKIVGPDVTIIIMTSYDWYSIEQEAKSAGVNLLISKPMFKSNLISTFSKVLEQKEDEQQSKIISQEYDFTGKRLLLVEDQPINSEIAQMILEDVGFKVEIAENGLRAIEMFSKTESGYYDAILMDIRMPIMNGIQASKNIRHLSNKDAKKIPIIAMTADAFDEDADKSKAAGMNVHLSKPIDPPKLYKTLYNFIYQKE